MGIFRSKPRFQDKIWVKRESMVGQRFRYIQEDIAAGHLVLLVHHFESTFEDIHTELTQRGLRYKRLTSVAQIATATDAGWSMQADALILDSANIDPQEIKLHKKRSDVPECHVHVMEKFPTPERDHAVLALVQKYRWPAPRAYTSLDDPWLVMIMGDRVQTLLEKLGVNEDESLDHHLISNSIRSAQVKTAERVPHPQPARSVSEWVDMNMGDQKT